MSFRLLVDGLPRWRLTNWHLRCPSWLAEEEPPTCYSNENNQDHDNQRHQPARNFSHLRHLRTSSGQIWLPVVFGIVVCPRTQSAVNVACDNLQGNSFGVTVTEHNVKVVTVPSVDIAPTYARPVRMVSRSCSVALGIHDEVSFSRLLNHCQRFSVRSVPPLSRCCVNGCVHPNPCPKPTRWRSFRVGAATRSGIMTPLNWSVSVSSRAEENLIVAVIRTDDDHPVSVSSVALRSSSRIGVLIVHEDFVVILQDAQVMASTLKVCQDKGGWGKFNAKGANLWHRRNW